MRLLAISLAVAALTSASALAHPAARDSQGPRGRFLNKETPKEQGGKDQEQTEGREEVETEDIFGFSVGTDILAQGKFETSLEGVGTFGRRGGLYRVGLLTGTLAFAPVDRLSLEFGATGTRVRIRDVPGLNDRDTSGLSSISTEIKWQIVKRDEQSPFGLTFVAEPTVGFMDEESGERGRNYDIEMRLAADTAVIRDKVFAGVNLIYEAERFRPRGFEPVERSSEIGLSGALAFQAAPNLFIGGEMRYRRAYEGLALQDFQGHALFLGPTLFSKVGEHLSISAAWSAQVAGHAVGVPGRLDLENFSRHEAKLKLSYEF